jgi:hypothetical protein
MATVANSKNESLWNRINQDIENALGMAYPGSTSNPVKDIEGVKNVVSTGAGAAKDLGSLDSEVGQFLANISSRDFWLRAGEVLAGLLLLYAGIRGLTEGGSVTGHAVKGTKKSTTKLSAVGKTALTKKSTKNVGRHRAA